MFKSYNNFEKVQNNCQKLKSLRWKKEEKNGKYLKSAEKFKIREKLKKKKQTMLKIKLANV